MNDYGMVLFCFDSLIRTLNDRASEYRRILHEASDIMDDETSQELWYSARKKISVIRDLITKSEALKEEILNADIIEIDPDDIGVPSEQVSANNESQNPEATDENWKPLGYNLTRKKVTKFSFNNKVYEASGLSKAYVKICELLYDYDKNRFEQLVNDEYAKGNRMRLFSRDDNYRHPGDESNYYRKMSNAELYIWVNSSNESKTQNIIYMLNYFNLPKDTVKLYIKGN